MQEVLAPSGKTHSTPAKVSYPDRAGFDQSGASDLRFYAELLVEHSAAEVWTYFSDLTKWANWSPICTSCRLVGSQELSVGSILNISFRILGVIISVPARITSLEPAESITWTGQWCGITAIHTYRFTEKNSGTLLSNEESLSTGRLPLRWLIKRWYRATGLSKASLEGIQRELEKRG